MVERLSARLVRISTDAEFAANVVVVQRNRFDDGPAESWQLWNRLYQRVDGAMGECFEAMQFLREHPDCDLEV